MRKTFYPSLLILSFLFFAPRTVFAADLAPETQKVLDKGLAAADQGEWDMAIRYFTQVREADPFYFPAYFNLALANQKKGKELSAIAWFNAYLYHMPQSKERAAIEKELTALEVAAEAKMIKIFDQALDLAQTLPNEGQYSSPRKTALNVIFMTYSQAGLLSDATNMITKYSLNAPDSNEYNADAAARNYAEKLAGEGDVTRVEEMVKKLPLSMQDSVYAKMVSHFSEEKKWDTAFEYASKISAAGISSNWFYIESLLKSLGSAGKTGDIKAFIEKVTDPNTKFQTAVTVASALAQAGKAAEAREILAGPVAYFNEVRPKYMFGLLVPMAHSLSLALIDAGDETQARQIADSLDLSQLSADLERVRFVEIYARLGDGKKAREIFSAMSDLHDRKRAAHGALNAFIKKGNLKEAETYFSEIKGLDLAPDELPNDYARLAWGKLKEGDQAGFDRIAASVPLRQEWQTSESPENKQAFYCELFVQADKAGDSKRAEEFYGMITHPFYRAIAYSARISRLLESGKLDEAKALVTAASLPYEKDTARFLFEGLAFDLVKAYIKEKNSKDAAALLDSLQKTADELKVYKYYQPIVDLYLEAGEKEKAVALQKLAADVAWADLAAQLEASRTADPDAFYKEITKESPDQVPIQIAVFGVQYAEALRKIERLNQKFK